MCGIFGIISGSDSGYNAKELKQIFIRLARLSERRGRESSGIAAVIGQKNQIAVFKGALRISKALECSQLNLFLNDYFKSENAPYIIMGHSRLATNGSRLNEGNNQPVVKNGIVAIHNGIIVNAGKLFVKHNRVKREFSIDTEIIPSLINEFQNTNLELSKAVEKTKKEIEGTASSALLFSAYNAVHLFSNNGSLYYANGDSGILIFASEKYILENALSGVMQSRIKTLNGIKQMPLNEGLWAFPDEKGKFCFDGTNGFSMPAVKNKSIVVSSLGGGNGVKKNESLIEIEDFKANAIGCMEKVHLEYNIERIRGLKRCSKCILPETFPFIEFDENGVCNYCRGYVIKNRKKEISRLTELIEPYRRGRGRPDCIIPYSGGRDSSFLLHYSKSELGLNPIAFTYDWGMVTDLARRNIARLCGKLGIENIIVSADIDWKRENIRKNISAWLKKPELGMIPIFMAGDKYFFYYTNKVKNQTGISLNIWGINPLENTDFKTGFAGIKPAFNKARIYSISYANQLKLLSFVAGNYIKNPGYVNQSVLDTLGSYIVRYFYPGRDYYHFYDYFQWNEKLIEDTLINRYDWEKAIDTNSTWRIGDGTAGFYNYLYFTIAGFSENDTFRSNQVREGMITREYALKKAEEENFPRYESIKWYLQIVGLDFEDVIKRINEIKKLY